DVNLRIPSAQEFIKRLRSAFRTDFPLSKLLTDARLHELIGALKQMSAEDFNLKPKGQKLLLVNRLKDLLRTDKVELRSGTIEFISLLVRLARHEGEAEYRPIVEGALDWGFEKGFGFNWQGDQGIRDGIIDASKAATKNAHQVLSKTLIEFFAAKDMASLP